MDNCAHPAESTGVPDTGTCRLAAEVFQQPMSKIGELKLPRFTRDEHPDGSTTITDGVGLQIEVYPSVSDRVRNSVVLYAASMPEPLRKSMAEAGIPIYVTNKISDLNPDLAGKPLPFDDVRESWDEVGAAFFDNSPGMMDGIGRVGVVVTPDYLEAMPHEGAHALDFIMGQPSRSQEFHALWQADLQSAREHNIPIRPYLAQPGDRGPEETFAEVYEALESKLTTAKDAEVLRTFPCVADYMRTKVIAVR